MPIRISISYRTFLLGLLNTRPYPQFASHPILRLRPSSVKVCKYREKNMYDLKDEVQDQDGVYHLNEKIKCKSFT